MADDVKKRANWGELGHVAKCHCGWRGRPGEEVPGDGKRHETGTKKKNELNL